MKCPSAVGGGPGVPLAAGGGPLSQFSHSVGVNLAIPHSLPHSGSRNILNAVFIVWYCGLPISRPTRRPPPGSPQPHLASRYKRREGVCVSLIASPLPGRFSPQKTQTYRARNVFVLAVCRRRVGGPRRRDGAQVPALSHCSKLVSAVSCAIS